MKHGVEGSRTCHRRHQPEGRTEVFGGLARRALRGGVATTLTTLLHTCPSLHVPTCSHCAAATAHASACPLTCPVIPRHIFNWGVSGHTAGTIAGHPTLPPKKNSPSVQDSKPGCYCGLHQSTTNDYRPAKFCELLPTTAKNEDVLQDAASCSSVL